MIVNRKSRQKVNKKIEHLNNIKKQIDLTGTYKIFHPTIAEYMFFSSVYEYFSGNTHTHTHTHTHTLVYKANLMVLKRIEIFQSIFSDHNESKLEINNRG